MPGPMSAPNGMIDTWRPRDPNKHIVTGKTALKRGQIKHATKEGEIRRAQKLTRARRQQQEES